MPEKTSNACSSIPELISVVKSCRGYNELRRLHGYIVRSGRIGNVVVENTLIGSYSRHGSLDDARRVFDGIQLTSLSSWNAIIKAYAQSDEKDSALQLFATLLDHHHRDLEPDARTFVAVLNACAGLATRRGDQEIVSLERAMALHSELRRRRLCIESSEFLASSLLDLYVKSGALMDARRVFDEIRSVSSWNVMILGYAENDLGEMALELFSLMRREGVDADARTFVSAFVACSALAARESGAFVNGSKIIKVKALETVMALHSLMSELLGQETNCFVAATLLSAYSKCGSMEDASRVFQRTRYRDLMLWTSLVLGFTANRDGEAALETFSCMLRDEDLRPDSRSIIAALRACSSLAAEERSKVRCLETGMALHGLIQELGLEVNIFVANSLLDMYTECGSMDDAWVVFDKMPRKTIVTWTAIVSGYVKSGEAELALKCFETMLAEGFEADAQAYLPVLAACTKLAEGACRSGDGRVLSLERAMALHSQARRSGNESSVFVATALIDLYAKCGSHVDAERVFEATKSNHGLAPWSSMILALAESGQSEAALELFQELLDQGLEPDSRTFVAALSACSSLAAREELVEKQQELTYKWLETGMDLHSRAAMSGFDRDIFIANTLIDMYSKFQCMEMARRVFESMDSQRTTVSWNAIISGYVEAEKCHKALELFQRMEINRDATPNAQTFASVLKACSGLALLDAGRDIHRRVREAGLMLDESSGLLLANSLVTFYGKCGSMTEAEQAFGWIRQQRKLAPVAWNNLLAGYSHCGDTGSVLESFEKMTQDHGSAVRPDATTFLWLLVACRHSGLVEDGKRYFEAMLREPDVVPGMEHYNCLVDMLGRAGFVEECLNVVRGMCLEPDATIWKTVLNACIHWRDWNNARVVFQKLGEVDRKEYILMFSRMR